ncbi:hypothetical protein [Vibrio profundi]|uniref:hypothetical protein n=1 Tax=Vibrio profundi TaxID=1774960 RepID=UPI003735A9C0
MVSRLLLVFALYWSLQSFAFASIPTSGQYTGDYKLTLRAAPLGNVMGYGVTNPEWIWDFETDTVTISGTTLTVGFNYALHDLNDIDPASDTLHFERNNDGTLTVYYAFQIYHPGLGNPMANTSTTFEVVTNGARLEINALDREPDGQDGIAGTKIYNVFPLTIEPDLVGTAVQVGADTNLDGISDELAISLGLNPNSFDTDGDGVTDRDEIGSDLTSPLDSDSDSIIDALEAGDKAYDASHVDGLVTENLQGMSVALEDGNTFVRVVTGSMKRQVSSPDSSDDFAQLDSTFGQPGLEYPWGNLSLTWNTLTPSSGRHVLILHFTEPLPNKVLLYGLTDTGSNEYQIVSSSQVERINSHTLKVTLSHDDAWLSGDGAAVPYSVTLAAAENTLGGKSLKQEDVSAGGLGVVAIWFLGLAFWRRYF